jgi:protein associated with RNAse G/E
VAEIRVTYRKYDGTLHWNHGALLLGEDRHGVWVGVGATVPVFRGEEAFGPPEAPFVILVPRDAWWTAMFNAAPHRTEIYCDVTTVPQWPTGSEVTMVDLDLDVRRRRTGAVELLDEDEFAEHQEKYGYPAQVVTEAEAAAAWLVHAITAHAEPFGVASFDWLARVT